MYTRTGPVMACITPQESCRRIIEAAAQLAAKMGTGVEVVTIQPKTQDAKRRAQDMKTLCQLASRTGFEIKVRYSDHPAKSVATAARECGAVHIFTGMPAGSADFVGKLSVLLENVPISLVSNDVYCTLNLAAQLS